MKRTQILVDFTSATNSAILPAKHVCLDALMRLRGKHRKSACRQSSPPHAAFAVSPAPWDAEGYHRDAWLHRWNPVKP